MRRDAGFTDTQLSDRLIPLVIVGILIAIAVPNYLRTAAQSRAMKDLQAIEEAERAYRKEHGAWTTEIGALGVELTGSAEVVAIAEAGSNGALVLRASGGKMSQPIERRLAP